MATTRPPHPGAPPPAASAALLGRRPRRAVDDRVCLLLPSPQGPPTRRWWGIEQPRPTVALALQHAVVAALGPAAHRVLVALLRLSEDLRGFDGPAGDLERDSADPGLGEGAEAMALDAFRRASTGRSLVDHGEPVDRASARLRAVLSYLALQSPEGKVDHEALLGVHTGSPARGYQWTRVGLAYRLLYDSCLEFGGEGENFVQCGGVGGAGAPLAEASGEAGPAQFVEALDALVVSADELRLLLAWVVLHLMRPF